MQDLSAGLLALTFHQKGDIAYYVLFFLGQCVYVLKRAAMAVRSKTNPIKTRRAFLKQNWDILSIRTAMEFPIYFIWRHYTLAQILGVLHLTLNVPFSTEAGGPLTYFVLGFASDTILDWISTSDKIPLWLQNWIREQIPDVSQSVVQQVTPPPIVLPKKPEIPPEVIEKLEKWQDLKQPLPEKKE